jgi:hypothetical protein
MSAHIQVRLTIEHMRREMLQSLSAYSDELNSDIRAAVEKAVSSFDFDTEVNRIVYDVLRYVIRERVEQMVRQRVSEATESIIGDVSSALASKLAGWADVSVAPSP